MLTPVLILSGLGVVFGAGLAIAAKKFCVVSDPRLEKIYAKLPGANCGACGLPGCMGLAEALIKGTCTVERCVVMQEEAREEIAGILGVQAREKVKTAAVLHCHGGSLRAKDKFIYVGEKDCIAANLIAGGPKECFYGCIGYGTCAHACPFGAITMNEESLPVVNEDKCTACGICVAACPKKLFSLVPVSKTYAVRCKSQDIGKKVLEACSVGCIACRKCEKACPVGAIKVINNLAVIDYNLCDNRGECFKVCPAKCIALKENKVWKIQRE
ncbi:4Fe-4S dicluster domain-containing protein [bacterium]|nr:MAG: 4Fe-4S dicluster domain-containing protein [bacterium]